MNLKTSVQVLLSDALRMCNSCEDADKLKSEIVKMRKRLDEPLRVAVVGFVKAGKSTLMNAIMKEKILYTGAVETTSNPSWFKYSDTKSITVVFKDGAREKYAFEELGKWTVKAETDKNPRAQEVKYIEIGYPNEVLKTMELIDTPGFGAVSTASDKSMEFLGFKKTTNNSNEDLNSTQITKDYATEADAIIYSFSKTAQIGDKDILEAFQGDTLLPNTSPINALGVLTKADIMWDVLDNNDPIVTAQEVSNKLTNDPALRSLVYTITPVSSKIVENILELGDREWDILNRLSQLDEQFLLEILFDKNMFINNEASDFASDLEKELSTKEEHNICSSAERKHICEICEQYGVYIISKALKEGVSRSDIIEYMYEKSGIRYLSDLIHQHFGNRSFLIKVKYMFSHLNVLATQIMLDNSGNKQLEQICEYIKEEIDNIQSTEQLFKELKVMQNYYNGLLKFKNEQEFEQFLQITGENGCSCEAKLGVSKDNSLKDLEKLGKEHGLEIEGVYGYSIKYLEQLAKEHSHYWNKRANDIPITRYYEEAANVFSRSYQILYHHLQALSGE